MTNPNLNGDQFVDVSRFNDTDIRPGDYRSWADAAEPFSRPEHQVRLRMAQDEMARGETRPVQIRKTANGERLVDGHHRVIAHKIAGYPTIPAEYV